MFGTLSGKVEVGGHFFGDETPVSHCLVLVEFFEDLVLLFGPNSFLVRDHYHNYKNEVFSLANRRKGLLHLGLLKIKVNACDMEIIGNK